MKKNPFEDIYKLCNTGNAQEKYDRLPSFPYYIDIEMTNTCNFKCLMCPTGVGIQTRKKGFMSDKVFYKILNEIKPNKTPLRFIGWGEPLMNKNLIKYITDATDNGILCHLNSNGSNFDANLIKKLIESGLHSIKFSFQGVDRKSYQEMRNIDYYKELRSVIAEFYHIRGNHQYPFIHVSTTITYETYEQIQEFKKVFEPITDLVTVGRTILDHFDVNEIQLKEVDRKILKKLQNEESVIKKLQDCPEVYNVLTVNWDGKVSACCRDYDNIMNIGDVNIESLNEIWNSEKMNYYRKNLAEQRHELFKLCRTCYDYQSLQTPGLQETE